MPCSWKTRLFSHDTRFLIFIWWHRRSHKLSLAILGLSANLIGCAQNVEKQLHMEPALQAQHAGVAPIIPPPGGFPLYRETQVGSAAGQPIRQKKGPVLSGVAPRREKFQ